MLINLISGFIQPKRQKDKQYILIIKHIRVILEKIIRHTINTKDKQAINICIKLCLRIEKTLATNNNILSEHIDELIESDRTLIVSSDRNTRLLFSIMNKYISNW